MRRKGESQGGFASLCSNRSKVKCSEVDPYMASLDSVILKIARAEEHRKAVETEIIRYFNGKPCEAVTEFDDNAGRFRIIYHVKVPVPNSIPLIVGDCLQNLRTALDYLAWELVLFAGNNPTKQTAFPVCESESVFD